MQHAPSAAARRHTHWLIGVFQNLTGIDLEGIAASFGITALVAALTRWATTLAGIDWGDPIPGLMTAIGAFITPSQDLGNWLLGVIEVLAGLEASVSCTTCSPTSGRSCSG